MESKFPKFKTFERDSLKFQADKPVILKNNDNYQEKQDNEKLRSLAYELKTIKELNKSNNKNDFLCEAFFRCGVSENNKIILDSENSLAPCYHSECSILPSIKAEILNKFPMKNNNFDINSTVKFYIKLDCFFMLSFGR